MDEYIPNVDEIVFRAIRRSGAAALVVPPQGRYPPEFLAVEGDKTTRIRVVMMPIFQEAPATDYRMLVTTEPDLIPDDDRPENRVIVVGYQFDADIFVGFDLKSFRKHLVPGGYVTIPWWLIARAEEHSLSFAVRVGNEFPHPMECRETMKITHVDQVLAAFTPEHFLHFVQEGAGWLRTTDVKTVEAMFLATTAKAMPDAKILALTEERARMAKTIYVWLRDGRFSKRVLKAYNYQCAITGLQLELPVAAHILPVASGVKNDTVSNGISLSPTFHSAMDDGLIYLAYDSEDRLHLKRNGDRSSYLRHRDWHGRAEMVLEYAGKEILTENLPAGRGDWPDPKMVEEGNRWRGVKK